MAWKRELHGGMRRCMGARKSHTTRVHRMTSMLCTGYYVLSLCQNPPFPFGLVSWLSETLSFNDA